MSVPWFRVGNTIYSITAFERKAHLQFSYKALCYRRLTLPPFDAPAAWRSRRLTLPSFDAPVVCRSRRSAHKSDLLISAAPLLPLDFLLHRLAFAHVIPISHFARCFLCIALPHYPPHTLFSHALPHCPPHTLFSHALPHCPPHTQNGRRVPDRIHGNRFSLVLNLRQMSLSAALFSCARQSRQMQ